MNPLISAAYRGVNGILALLGLRLQRLHSPTRSFWAFFDHVKSLNFDVKTVIDVGVAFGTPGIYQSFPSARYYLIEPVAECRPVLERLKRELNAELYLVAAGATDGTVTFNVHDDVSGSSLFPQVEGSALDGEARQIPMRRLDSLLPKELAHPTLLKIDTQGAEIEVLKGLGARIAEIDLLILETSMMPMRRGIPEFAEIVRFCDDAGFAVYDVLEGHNRLLDGALAQVDLAFVRKDSALRKNAAFFSPKQLADYLEMGPRKRRLAEAE
jgi:FkbM family methyltransferase